MSEPRRLSVSSHPPRKRGTPAYQVRRGQRPASAGANGATTPPDTGIDKTPAAAAPGEPEATIAPADPISTGAEAMPVIVPVSDDAAVDDQLETDPLTDEPTVDDDAAVDAAAPSEDVTNVADTSSATGMTDAVVPAGADQVTESATADSVASATEDSGDGEADYAGYARSVEEAAARSRLEMAPQAAATAALPTIQPPIVHRPPVRQMRGRPVVGSRVRSGSGGRGNNGGRGRTASGERNRDPRPLLKRLKTWFVIFGIIVAAVAIGAVLWAANIARITYDAYNEAHVDLGDRPVYTINPQGTPEVVPTEQVEASLPDWDNQDPFNVLLMGIDDREGDTEPPRSDTMIVMRINPATNHVVTMSIPRDLLVYIPVVDRWDKLNAAYPIGEEQQDNGGPSAVMQTIESNFDVRIHYFVTVDFEGFRTIVDTVGGVIIDVPAPVKDDQYPTESFGITREYFPTGLQKMDGETALRYSRTRHGDNDIARGDRQQQMLIALREQAVDLGLITRAEELIRQFGKMVKTDFNFNQLLALANLGRNVDPNGISKINLWDAGVLSEHVPEDELDPFYFEGDWPAVHDLMDVYFKNAGDDPPPPTPTVSVPSETTESPVADDGADDGDVNLDVPIIVQNNSDFDQLATVVSQVMYDAGFSVVSPETGSGAQAATVIYDYAESPATALYIASQLGLDESSIVYGNGGNGIVVELGTDLAWLLDE